jgi:hypothetical protein
LSRPATGIFIKPHPGSISIWEKTIPQKDKAVVRPESKKGGFAYASKHINIPIILWLQIINSIFKPKMISIHNFMQNFDIYCNIISFYKGD